MDELPLLSMYACSPICFRLGVLVRHSFRALVNANDFHLFVSPGRAEDSTLGMDTCESGRNDSRLHGLCTFVASSAALACCSMMYMRWYVVLRRSVCFQGYRPRIPFVFSTCCSLRGNVGRDVSLPRVGSNCFSARKRRQVVAAARHSMQI